jgi:uncharacterized protein
MKVWIDLSNSPHPLLFAPVARVLEELGHTLAVTARDNAQTAELARARWSHVEVIGDESPSTRPAKGAALLHRVKLLRRWARIHHPDIAVSHNSYSQIVAARLAGIRVVTAMDFEHQPANHVAFRAANAILLPRVLRDSIRRYGARHGKIRLYPGLKEELYLGDFEPDHQVLEKVRIERRDDTVLVVVRTPPSRALYHRFENPLFPAVLETLGRQQAVRVVALARHPEQRLEIAALGLKNVFVPQTAVDSRSLTYFSDLVIGAGGTMTREAALMGVPTLSVYAGKQPAVDRSLEEAGRLNRLETVDQIEEVQRRSAAPESVQHLRERSQKILGVFVNTIETTG